MFGGFVLDLFSLVRRPQRIPWTEISANIYSAGAQALAITALVAFLIGIVLSYLSAQQLRMFGANQYIVNILGLSVIRELGPVLSAILVAGRSGSAITAQIGVMRVTEELDAMRVMGIPHGLRLVLPRVIALGIRDAAARHVDQHHHADGRRACREARAVHRHVVLHPLAAVGRADRQSVDRAG